MRPFLMFAASLLSLLIITTSAEPCSRIFWNDNGHAMIVGRNMDWFEDMKSNIWIMPRGIQRSGLSPQNPMLWTSKYGSIGITGYEAAVLDGINEKGLAVHALYLPETTVPVRDTRIPGLSISQWVQYYLDNFATVNEAVQSLKSHPYQLLMVVEPISRKAATVHLALNDKTGDSAILECIEGEIKVYHDRSYTVMTNQPTFDKQLENLKQYRGFGGEKRLPGTHEPADRFVRGAYYVKNLPKPKNDREAVAAMMSVMRNVSAPFGIADSERPNVSTTIWRTVTDLSNGVLYYDSVFSPQVFWVKLANMNFAEGQPVRKIKVVDNFELSGDVSGKAVPTEHFEVLKPQ